MHIAQFIHRYPPAVGGAELYMQRLGRYLATHGDHVTVWTSTAQQLEEMWQRPVRQQSASSPFYEQQMFSCQGDSSIFWVKRYPPLRFPTRRYVLKALSLVRHPLWQCLTAPCNPICLRMWNDVNTTTQPLDAVHAAAFPYSFPIACAWKLARRRQVPFLLTPFLHLGDPTDLADRTRKQYTAPHLRWLLRQADAVFVQTRWEREAVASLGVADERIVQQGLGVDVGECTGGDRHGFRAQWGITHEILIGHLSNNSAEKGTVDLLRAAQHLWRSGERFRIVLAGPEMPNFRAFWSRFPEQQHVLRLGVLNAPQKRDFFAGIDLFALPSRSDSFGLVLLEAWANAKPVVVYRAGGPAELVRDGIDGLQARCGDVAGLAAGLHKLLKDASLRHRLGLSGCARIAREFLWPDKLARFREVLETLQRGAKTSRRHQSAA
ncbi:MAG: glycosyltransferase family 4 protein [Gemmataceae bacterium]|nr:glycosyltransferase family 4 protein [Gemmata sp.]MDW8199211.1 glycosyltransferase family 4 protein [Gemmataceae bacterium]